MTVDTFPANSTYGGFSDKKAPESLECGNEMKRISGHNSGTLSENFSGGKYATAPNS